jgi:signal transduction histidine kinase
LKFGGGFITRNNQLQWAVLLAVAVLLPTVSLLWFMSRAVANERLVVQQKLAALYQDKLDEATARTKSACAARLAALDKNQSIQNPYAIFQRLVLEENLQGVVVWDADGALVYPQSADPAESSATSDSPLADAWQQEFAKNDYAEAAKLYARAATDANPGVAIPALVGQSRCLARLNQPQEAIAACQKAAFATLPDHPDSALLLAAENARLHLLSLLNEPGRSQSQAELFHRTVAALGNDLYNPAGDRALLPANQNLFIAKKVLAALQTSPSPVDAPFRDKLARLAAAEELSLAAAESSRPSGAQLDSFFQYTLDQQRVYALRHRTQTSTVLLLLSETGVATFLAAYQDTFSHSESVCRILDDSGQLVTGATNPPGKPFLAAGLPAAFPGWKVELYFQGGDVFEKAAKRQIAVYIWTAGLVILLMLIVGAFATQAVGKQIRLNSMKNNFIATVSHELKTPLASMRVLVDTLLEGRVRDQAQVTEYLRLTSKENERLSRMIDNFLTFSRMERNKVAFAPVEAQPAAIAHDAVESVKTKFAAQDCQFTLEIADPLPEIRADHDAIVTVLVNLLDNACKYTNDDKQISLKVFSTADRVCFAVTDNGIGLARRHLKRIFDRFYQVDSSLARKAEGCGLGLSIVKFIVDAHKGKITVESKPGRGSTFTVSLPANGRNGDGKTHQSQE